jgi:Carboxypeptidase regulatory-like domain
MKAHLRWVATFCVVLTFSLSLLAQDTGQLTGTVHDSSGAAIANAQVVVSNSSQGINRPTTSNASGDWLVSGLPVGSYDLSITAPGFKKYQARGIVLRIGQKLRADAVLQVGAATTEITVQGTNVAQVETQSSDLAGTVTGKQISQLQLNGRNFTQLAALVPGVSNQTGQDEAQVGVNGSVAFSFNGGRTEYNNWEIDGGDNMDNGSNGTLNVYPSIDAIAEVRVLTSNYGAQYGRNGSGTVETDTKSGTSAFHGDVYEFVRNDIFNARNYFEQSVPPYKKNDYGYTIGGPVYIPGVYNKNKDKTFFFWSQEWRKDRVPGQTFNVRVPSAAERLGNFSDLCPNVSTGSMKDCPVDPTTGVAFPGNVVPVAPMAQDLLPLIPAANAGVPGAALFNASPGVPTNWREELIRVDHNFSPKWRAMFRYIHDSWDTVTPTSLWTGSAFPTVQTSFSGPAVSAIARITTNVSPTLLNEFMVSYTTDHIILGSTGSPNPKAWQRPATLPMGFLFNNGGGGKLPAISLTGSDAYNGGFYEDPNGVWPEGPYNSNPTYTYRDNVTKIVGRHNLQFGAYAVTAQKNELGSLQINGVLNYDISSPVSTGNSFADLLTGRIASFEQGSNQIKFYQRYKILEPYFQDDWRVTDRLTLNLGMRVSLFGTYREKYNNAYNWDPAAYNPATAPKIDVDGSVTGFAGALIPGSGNKFDGLVRCGVTPGVPVGCMEGHVFNPSPRVGFAYDPSGNGKTAIRGGYGIFFEHTNGNEASTEGLEGQSSPLLQTSNQHNVVGYTSIGGGGTGPAIEFPISFQSLPGPRVVWPYMQQWHLDVQHEVAHNTVATVSYVGSKGTHLTRLLDLNQLPGVPLAQNPYKPGEPIGGTFDLVSGSSVHDDCGTMTTPSGVPVTGQAAIDLQVACGADPNPFRPFHGVGSITRLENKSSSIYHAFQTSVRRTVGALQVNLAYTYSHSIDDSSDRYDGGTVDSYNPAAFRASSNFDIRHMLAVSYIYDLPFFKSGGLTHKLLGGWQLSGITTWQSGTPVSISNSAAFPDNAGVANGASSSQFANSFPDVVGSPRANVPNVPLDGFGPLIANPGAFVAPRGLTFGDAGRNNLTNPSWSNWNMALFKHFVIHEQVGLEFRAEAFNIWNHTEWAPIGGNAGSVGNAIGSGTNSFSCYGGANNSGADPGCLGSSFLHVGATHPARILQLGLKFLF